METFRNKGQRVVVFYGHCAKMSGAEIALLNTTSNMSRGRPIVVLGEDGPLHARLKAAGVEVHILPLAGDVRNASRSKIALNGGLVASVWKSLIYIRLLRAKLRSLDPDVLVSNSMKGHLLVAGTGLWARTSFFCYVRDRVSTDFMSRLGVVLIRLTLRIAPIGVLANSKSTMETVPKTRRGRAAAIIPSPILTPNHTAIGSGSDDMHFALVGRIAEWKGQELAIRAFADLVTDTPAQLTLIGGALFEDAAYLDRLRTLITDLGLSSNVHLTGHVDDVYAALKSVDAVIHTSIIPEPFGQVVVQAMAMGLPVLASGEGGPLETITDGKDGLFFEPRDVRALTDGMMRLAKDPDLRSRLGAAAVDTARQYSPEILVAKLERFLLDS